MMIAYTVFLVTIILMTRPNYCSEMYSNSFDAIKGCLQFDDVPGYNETQMYFATDKFRNVGRTHNSRFIRMGVVGSSDGHIRFGRSPYPYDETVVEIVIGGWWNSQSVFRRQIRRRDHSFDNVLLKEASTPRVLSRSRPLVFQMEVFDNGRIQLTKDGERRPFLEYVDNQQTIPMDYVAFTKWEADMIYFYDCPLLNDSADPSNDTVVLRCSLAYFTYGWQNLEEYDLFPEVVEISTEHLESSLDKNKLAN